VKKNRKTKRHDMNACCFTTGKKGRVLEQEIKELVEQRNLLTAKSRRPLYRKVSAFCKLLIIASDLYCLFWDICVVQ
jgi:hypothetical protein